MNTQAYPNHVDEIVRWAALHRVTEREARDRFAQQALLGAIARVPTLRNVLVFKGGNALDFVLLPNRSTIDLDFSLDMSAASELDSPTAFGTLLEIGLADVCSRQGIVLNLHSVQSKPPGVGRTFVTM